MSQDIVKLKDLEFQLYTSYGFVDYAISQVAKKLNKIYKDEVEPVHIICVLNGAVMFCSDLMKELEFPVLFDTVKISSYQGTQSGELKVEKHLDKLIKSNEKLLIVEDIVDTGKTIDFLVETITKTKGNHNITVATMLLKPDSFEKNHKLSTYPVEIYYGMEIDNKFVVGYGLDYDGLGRNLHGIYVKV